MNKPRSDQGSYWGEHNPLVRARKQASAVIGGVAIFTLGAGFGSGIVLHQVGEQVRANEQVAAETDFFHRQIDYQVPDPFGEEFRVRSPAERIAYEMETLRLGLDSLKATSENQQPNAPREVVDGSNPGSGSGLQPLDTKQDQTS